jgi:hypothetical protein
MVKKAGRVAGRQANMTGGFKPQSSAQYKDINSTPAPPTGSTYFGLMQKPTRGLGSKT